MPKRGHFIPKRRGSAFQLHRSQAFRLFSSSRTPSLMRSLLFLKYPYPTQPLQMGSRSTAFFPICKSEPRTSPLCFFHFLPLRFLLYPFSSPSRHIRSRARPLGTTHEGHVTCNRAATRTRALSLVRFANISGKYSRFPLLSSDVQRHLSPIFRTRSDFHLVGLNLFPHMFVLFA